MRLLLDTCVLLWCMNESPKLGFKFRKIIKDTSNIVFVSTASIWEISIKKSIGKLQISDDFESDLIQSGFKILDINFHHAWRTRTLPRLHNDPFDRILIAQALVEKLTVITSDKHFQHYPAELLAVNEAVAVYEAGKNKISSENRTVRILLNHEPDKEIILTFPPLDS